MVNQIILNYLRKYSGKYKLEDLKKKITNSGYSKDEVEEAVNLLGLDDVEEEIDVKFSGDKYSKLLKVAAICGILVFVFAILVGILGVSNLISLIFSSLSGVSMVIFYYGFFILGKKYNKKLLKTMSIVFIIFVALAIIGNILMFLFFDDVNNSVSNKIASSLISPSSVDIPSVIEAILSTFIVYLLVTIAVLLVMIILGILFGAGVLKLRENVKLAKAAGILYIIGYIILIIGIGAILLLVAHVLAIVMMFKASKQV